MKRLLLFLFLSLAVTGLAFAQGQITVLPGASGYFIYVIYAPTGSCSTGVTPELVVSTGQFYTCQYGTWGVLAGGGSSVSWQNQGTTIGTPAVINCLTNLTCSYGSGTVTISAGGGGGTPGGSNTQVQFNDTGTFNGLPLSYNRGTNTLAYTGSLFDLTNTTLTLPNSPGYRPASSYQIGWDTTTDVLFTHGIGFLAIPLITWGGSSYGSGDCLVFSSGSGVKPILNDAGAGCLLLTGGNMSGALGTQNITLYAMTAPTGSIGSTQFYMNSTANWPAFKPNGDTAYTIPGFSGAWAAGQCAVATGTTNVFDLAVCGTPAFSGLTGGTNTSAAMLVGGTASLGPTGGGTITANAYSGNLPVTNLAGGTGASASTYWRGDGSWGTPTGAGTVSGPVSSTGGNVAIWNGATGTILQDSTVVGANITTQASNGAANQVCTYTGANKVCVPGSVTNAMLSNAATTVNSQTCTLGSTCTIPFQTNTTGNTSQAGINQVTSTVNSVGLTDTPVNTGTNVVEHRITGSAYTGNAATATALASTPTQCSGGTPLATGIAANGNANCTGATGITLPQLIAGTVNSGGVMYFNDGTHMSSSAPLPSGDFVLGGGAGNPPTATFSVVPPVNGGTGVASPTAHTVPIAEGASNYVYETPNTAGYVLTSNGTGADPTFQANTALINPMTVVGQVIGGGSSGVPVAIAAGLTGQPLIATNGATPAFASSGLPAGNGGVAITTTPYTVLCDSATAQRDRFTLLILHSGASVVNVPDPTTSGCGNNFTFAVVNDGASTVTFNRATTAVFNITNGTSNSDAQTSFTLANGQNFTMNSPDNVNWQVRIAAPAGITSLATTSPITGGTITTTGTIACPTCAIGPGASVTSGDVASFNGTGGLILQDSNVVAANLVTAASTYSGNLITGTNAARTTSDSGIVPATVVTCATAGTSGDLLQFAGSNRTCSDSAIATGNVVTAAASLTNGAPVVGNGSKGISGPATGYQIESGLVCIDTSSSSTTYTCPTVPSFVPGVGSVVILTAINQNNSGASTLNVNSAGAKAITKWQNSTALASGDLQHLATVLVRYDGTNWELDTQGNAPAGSGTVSSCATTGGSAYYATGGTTLVGCLASVVESANTLTLGVAGSGVGNLVLQNATSGTLTLAPPTGALGTVTVTVPDIATTLIGESATDTTTTHVLHASANANVGTFGAIATGDLPTIPIAGGGTNATSAPSAGAIPNSSSTTASSWTVTPALGLSGTAGTLSMYPASGNFTTTWGSGATASNTINGFATVPTTGHLIDCTVTSTTCLLHDSGVVTANVVNASSPGAGVAHFAGSTQTVTSSAIVGSDMTANTVTATQLAAQYSKGACTEVWGGSGTSFALTSGDDAISNNTCYNDSGVTRTITAVKCRSDVGSNTTTVNPTFGSAGTGTTIGNGTPLTCGSSLAYSSTLTLTNTAWTTGKGINPVMAGTLTGTSIAMIVEYTF